MRATHVLPAAMLCFALAACATPQAPEQAAVSVVARNDNFLIVQPRGGETYASISTAIFGDASHAAVISEANDGAAAGAAKMVVVPLRPLLASAVYPDGYQVVPILAYHRFTRGKSTDLMSMPQSSFEDQMDYLAQNGYHVITLHEFADFLNGKTAIPKKSVVITIDDGFHSVYDIAYPILRAHGFKATLFVYTDFVGDGAALNWQQIKEMDRSGVIDIQAHSKTHSSLSRNAQDKSDRDYAGRVTKEIDVPDQLLSKNLGKPIDEYAYPYGDSSAVVVKLLDARRYEAAVTVWRGGNPAFSPALMLKRDMIYGNYTLADFQKSLKVYERLPEP